MAKRVMVVGFCSGLVLDFWVSSWFLWFIVCQVLLWSFSLPILVFNPVFLMFDFLVHSFTRLLPVFTSSVSCFILKVYSPSCPVLFTIPPLILFMCLLVHVLCSCCLGAHVSVFSSCFWILDCCLGPRGCACAQDEQERNPSMLHYVNCSRNCEGFFFFKTFTRLTAQPIIELNPVHMTFVSDFIVCLRFAFLNMHRTSWKIKQRKNYWVWTRPLTSSTLFGSVHQHQTFLLGNVEICENITGLN